jgi:hypothetical protein
MDQNKIIKLQEIGYQVERVCGTCKHFQQFEDMHFGECDEHQYTHLKHSGGKRKLSVVQYGKCNNWTPSDDLDYLHGFKQFLTTASD